MKHKYNHNMKNLLCLTKEKKHKQQYDRIIRSLKRFKLIYHWIKNSGSCVVSWADNLFSNNKYLYCFHYVIQTFDIPYQSNEHYYF